MLFTPTAFNVPRDASPRVQALGAEYGEMVAMHRATGTFRKHRPFVVDFLRFMAAEFPIWSGKPAELAMPCWAFIVPVYCAKLRRKYGHTISQVGSACSALNFWLAMHDAERIFNRVPGTVCKSVQRRSRSEPVKRSLGLRAWMVCSAIDAWFHSPGRCATWKLQIMVWSMLCVLGLFRHKSSTRLVTTGLWFRLSEPRGVLVCLDTTKPSQDRVPEYRAVPFTGSRYCLFPLLEAFLGRLGATIGADGYVSGYSGHLFHDYAQRGGHSQAAHVEFRVDRSEAEPTRRGTQRALQAMLIRCAGLKKAEAARITPHGARAEGYNRARRKLRKDGAMAVSLGGWASALGAEPYHRQMLREQLAAIRAMGF